MGSPTSIHTIECSEIRFRRANCGGTKLDASDLMCFRCETKEGWETKVEG